MSVRQKLLPKDFTHDDLLVMEAAPKAVLYGIAKHIASCAMDEGPDESLQSGSYLERMMEEWARLHSKGIIPQRPPDGLLKPKTSTSTSRRKQAKHQTI